MKQSFWKRSAALVLALILTLAAMPVTGRAYTMTELQDAHVELDQTAFQHTGEEIRPNVTVRVEEKLLTLDKEYSLTYADNIEVGTGKVIVTGIATGGYTGTVEVPFEITPVAPAFTLIELKGTDVTIDGTEFAYTGSAIEPAVTVTVEGQVLTAGRDYTVAYRNNVEPGTATVAVSGIATASQTLGYTGTVEMDFTITAPAPVELTDSHVAIEGTEFTYTGSYIEPKVSVTVAGKLLEQGKDYTLTYHSNVGVGTAIASVTGIEEAGYTGQVNVTFTIVKDSQTPEYQLVTLEKSHVTMEGTEFSYTGKAIEPKITVTVDGTELQLGRDYALTYRDNINVGTGTAIITGIATASETLGYTGTVEIPFTIAAAEEEAPEETPDETPEEVTYKITRGSKATWYRESTKTLSFTVNGWLQNFQGVKIDGKDLPEKYFTTKGDLTVTLTNAFLQKLDTGKHTITILFADGEAEGIFYVSEGLDGTNPETGDSFRLELWVSVMGISLAAVAGLLIFRKKFFS